MASVSDDMRALILSRIPLGRLKRVEEITAASVFLASDDSSSMAGSDLHVGRLGAGLIGW